MSSYYVMNVEEAKRYLEERDGESPLLLVDVQRLVGDGALIDLEPLTLLRDRLEQIKEAFPSELTPRSQDGGKFEQEACVPVFEILSRYPRRVLSDPDFWTWLAIAKFADIVEWRFAARNAHANFDNYGIGGSNKRKENLLYRMWIRCEIARDPSAEDEFELARTGDPDLWRSHIIRQGYGNSPEIAKALLRLQADKLGRKPLSVKGIRELAKRLRRLRANVFIEVLPAAKANELSIELSHSL